MHPAHRTRHRFRRRTGWLTCSCVSAAALAPLVDHGGKHNFVEWAAPNDPDLANCRLPLNVHEPSAARCPFYTNPKVIAAFKV